MSIARPRKYIPYKYVTLALAVEAPPRWLNTTGFSGEAYLFFVENGFFCIECRRTGEVIDVPPAQVRVARRSAAKPEEAAAQ